MTEFMRSMPWRGAAMQLRQRRFHELHQQWTPNDLNDIAYLTLALAYCDVLVTERQWVSRIREASSTSSRHDGYPRPARAARPSRGMTPTASDRACASRTSRPTDARPSL